MRKSKAIRRSFRFAIILKAVYTYRKSVDMARLTRMTIPISMELKSKLERKYGIVIARVVKIKERIDFVNESRTASNFIS
jgi:hypothetical protein